MDAFVQLALIEKAKRVFAADATVTLSFPLLAPIGFTTAELTGLSAPTTAADYVAAGDFARCVNFLPTDMVATTTERMLWDVYRDVLSRADVGDVATRGGGGPTGTDLLHEVESDGTRVDSEAYTRYRQYRDAWIVAGEDYAAHQLTGEHSVDSAELQHWTDIDEPRLRTALEAAATAWETLGGRYSIELALQAERGAALRDPRLRWAEWNDGFDPDLDMVNEEGAGPYAPTGFSPRNFADQEGWLTFELSASEMRALVDEAPDMLKRVLDDDGGTDIERVSFKYRSVAVVRPWFRSEVLTSGIWRSSDSALQLSDGGDPPKGSCVGYVTACVFVRNVEVTKRGTSTGRVFQDLRFTLDPELLTERLILDPELLTVRRSVRIDQGLAARIAVHPLEQPQPDPAPAVDLIAFDELGRSTFRMLAAPKQDPTREHFLQLAIPHPVSLADGILDNTQISFKLNQLDAPSSAPPPPQPSPPPSPPPAAPPAPPPPQPPPREEISILAFICKRLPKAPDPAPELDWGLASMEQRPGVSLSPDAVSVAPEGGNSSVS